MELQWSSLAAVILWAFFATQQTDAASGISIKLDYSDLRGFHRSYTPQETVNRWSSLQAAEGERIRDFICEESIFPGTAHCYLGMEEYDIHYIYLGFFDRRRDGVECMQELNKEGNLEVQVVELNTFNHVSTLCYSSVVRAEPFKDIKEVRDYISEGKTQLELDRRTPKFRMSDVHTVSVWALIKSHVPYDIVTTWHRELDEMRKNKPRKTLIRYPLFFGSAFNGSGSIAGREDYYEDIEPCVLDRRGRCRD